MPEENFEQQARRKAEEFGMEPNPNVWLRVKEAIAPGERRRRVLLWWWLLPLCLAGIVAFWLNNNRKASDQKELSVVKLDGNGLKQKESSPLEQNKKQSPLIVEQGKQNTKSSVFQMQDGQTLARKSGKEIKTDFSSEISVENRKNKQNEKENEIINGRSAGVITKDEDAQALADNVFYTKPESKTDTSHSIISIDSIDTKTETKRDSMFITNNENLTKKLTPDNATGKNKKAQKKKRWQMGVLAEVGLTSWGKDLFYNEVEAKDYVAPIGVGSAGDIATRDSILKNTTAIQQTKNGITAAAGLAVRKELAHHFYITGQLGYRYQQFRVYNLREPQASQTFLNTAYFVNKDNYHTHFVTLAMGGGKRLFSTTRNAISVEAVIDNSLLFALTNHSVEQSSAFSTAKSLGATDFYRWQPHVVIAFPFDWHSADKTRFLISPFARFGLHSFQKNGDDYKNNHLISAGVQAVYFFR